MKKTLFKILTALIISTIIIVLIHYFLIERYEIKSDAIPKIADKKVFVLKYSKQKIGKICMFSKNDSIFVSRIVACYGDTLTVSEGRAITNGDTLDTPIYFAYRKLRARADSSENISLIAMRDSLPNRFETQNAVYLKLTYPKDASAKFAFSSENSYQTIDNFSKIVVPAGHFAVLNDNRTNLNDSRKFGFIPIENYVGRVLFVK